MRTHLFNILSVTAFIFSLSSWELIDHGKINEEMVFEEMNHSLLNQTVLEIINERRVAAELDPLAKNEALSNLAVKHQNLLEFKSFNNWKRITSKLNKKLEQQIKKAGYKGAISYGLARQHNGINYDSERVFFHVKNDSLTKLGLYYGLKKDFKNNLQDATPIPNYSYRAFAEALISSLDKEQKKILFGKSYKDIGLHLQWHYKSLYKKKIPQIKWVCFVGGYATAGIR